MGITAQYHGSCTYCGEDIIPGQRIDGEPGEWRHDECGDRPVTAPCVCEKCFLVHAGECW